MIDELLGRLPETQFEQYVARLVAYGKQHGTAPWAACAVAEAEAHRRLERHFGRTIYQEERHETIARRKSP